MSATLLTEEDRRELRAIFDAFDHNADGLLDVDEVGAVLQSFGKPMTEAEVSSHAASTCVSHQRGSRPRGGRYWTWSPSSSPI